MSKTISILIPDNVEVNEQSIDSIIGNLMNHRVKHAKANAEVLSAYAEVLSKCLEQNKQITAEELDFVDFVSRCHDTIENYNEIKKIIELLIVYYREEKLAGINFQNKFNQSENQYQAKIEQLELELKQTRSSYDETKNYMNKVERKNAILDADNKNMLADVRQYKSLYLKVDAENKRLREENSVLITKIDNKMESMESALNSNLSAFNNNNENQLKEIKKLIEGVYALVKRCINDFMEEINPSIPAIRLSKQMKADKSGDKNPNMKIREQELINLVNCGLTRRELAKHFNVSESAISQRVKKLGLNPKRGSKSKKQSNSDDTGIDDLDFDLDDSEVIDEFELYD